MVWSGARASARRVSLVVLVGLATTSVAAAPHAGAAEAPARSLAAYHQWTSARDFAKGSSEGVRPSGAGALTIARTVGSTAYADPYGAGTKTWDYARWTSPKVSVGFGASQLVASWTADTPHGTWLQVEMRGHTGAGADTKWYVMGRWASDDPKEGGDINRTTVPGQADANGNVDIDTFIAKNSLTSYQLRVTLYRAPGKHVRPVLRSVGAMASLVAQRTTVPVSPLGGAEGIELKVPTYSQNIHKGQYPEYDGGGEAWCSPTSTSMVVGYWKRGPSKKDMSWVDPSYADPQVDYAARHTYDYNYEGTGNWPFNPAYAGRFGLNGFITRLRSVTELEQFIKAGIPVVTSQSFKADELPGSNYSTNGHLFVVVGFTKKGDPIINDPASSSDAVVRNVYPRANFENVWLRSSSSGGIAYIMYPPGHRLPKNIPGMEKNW
ncbi:C39 family peptidase [Actinoallomurus iriomotensis]|uniref:Membrane protein n=1 Tax=Actinoallomurus iriomotensis TaxID=478107 RepID=A0A9W6VN32_9ACTN|nr:C39 family peptidase [Actinoallomurus iriomotensis]GLY72141.1 membrane protein [Actinoallomurus iriomotensis]GLY82937.1 membrane protein [Actinoallomurus iriomotensis]